ncbi:aminoglycoside phosphotransferase [Paenibacillus mucilaginosus 3016]|uniref:Aminoglycoside phosphotransferase n=1 Tax=Paenibacillus mucilaginosus 3016 TaxID=1116391 RepID=H6NB41_9BACL|nr:phosphotransferase [Paenibacillus mucilaginosus]AFC31296.1 aminoglycoside phosphotransferase [Paenibacillus mucilaginosus 3016]
MTAPSGERAVSIELEDGHCCSASLMRWVEGAPASGRLTREQIFREGVLLAKLHKASQDAGLTGHPNRPVWGEDSFREAVSRLDAFHECFLSEAEFELYRAAAERIVSWIGRLEKHPAAYGFVHGDLHQGNIVFEGEEPRAIDFGRCGSGFYLYDIAHTILGLYPAQRELVLHGYESLRPLEAHWLPALEHFTIMVLIENYSHHAPDPRETEGLRAEQPYAQTMLKRFLSERPFLFQSLEG